MPSQNAPSTDSVVVLVLGDTADTCTQASLVSALLLGGDTPQQHNVHLQAERAHDRAAAATIMTASTMSHMMAPSGLQGG